MPDLSLSPDSKSLKKVPSPFVSKLSALNSTKSRHDAKVNKSFKKLNLRKNSPFDKSSVNGISKLYSTHSHKSMKQKGDSWMNIQTLPDQFQSVSFSTPFNQTYLS